MRSAIWKLSALATVVGLGLVAVVVQQKGFGLGATAGKGTAEAKAPAASAPDVSKGGAEPEAKPEGGDPFAAASSTGGETSDQPPLADVAAETADPTLAPAEAPGGEDPDAEFAMQSTKPRSKPRALNFKDNVENAVDNGNPADILVAEAAAAGAGRRNRSQPSDVPNQQGADPADMEGATVDEPNSEGITDESDPFQKHREALARQGTRARSGGESGDSLPSSQGLDPSESSPDNPFDPDAGASGERSPVVPVPGSRRTRPRARLIDENDVAATEPVNPAISEVAGDTAGYQPAAAPAGYRAQAAGAGESTTGSRATGNRGGSRTRPQLGDDEGFKTGAAATPQSVDPPEVPAGKAVGAGRRPQPLDDDDEIGTAPHDSTLPNGVEPIPKISRDSADEDRPAMTPAISKGGRTRPNPLADDGDEGLTPSPDSPRTQGNSFDAQGTGVRGQATPPDETDSGFLQGKSRRSSPHVLEIEPDRRPALPSTPEAAASRSMATDVVPVPIPERVSAAPAYSASGAVSGGRGRVTIEKRAPTTAYVGQPLIYQIFVRNVGNGPAQQVVVEDIVPEGVTMQGSIPQGELTGRKLAWRIGSLAAGEERKISVKVTPGAAGAIGSAATVKFVADPMFASAEGIDADSNIPAATSPRTTSRTTPRTGSGVLLELQAPRQVGAGQTFEVRMRLTNRVGYALNDLLIRSMLPGNLQHESRVQDLEYHVGTLAAGESREVPLALTAGQAGRADTRVMVMATNDQVLRTDDFSLDVTAGAASASLLSAGSELGTPQLAVDVIPPTGPIQVGGRVVYEIRLINRGSASVRQAALRIGMPRELRLVNAGPIRYRQEGDDLVFDAIPVLEAGRQSVVKVEFTAQAAGETYLNVQFVGAHMKRPLSREEGLLIRE